MTTANSNIIGVPPGTRLMRVEWSEGFKMWRVWIATNDFINGTYLELYQNGEAWNTTEREDEGPDTFRIR